MPKIQADFSNISSSTGAVPAGTYRCVIVDVEDGKTKESGLDQTTFILEVDDPAHPKETGSRIWDYCTLQQKDGKPNKMGLGRIKAYAEATLGEEAANSPEGIDPDEMKGSMVVLEVKQRSWEKKDSNGDVTDSGISNKIEKVLRAD